MRGWSWSWRRTAGLVVVRTGRCDESIWQTADEVFLTNSVRGIVPSRVARADRSRRSRPRGPAGSRDESWPWLHGGEDAMTTISEVLAWIETFAPRRLAESWDNVGLLWATPRRRSRGS